LTHAGRALPSSGVTRGQHRNELTALVFAEHQFGWSGGRRRHRRRGRRPGAELAIEIADDLRDDDVPIELRAVSGLELTESQRAKQGKHVTIEEIRQDSYPAVDCALARDLQLVKTPRTLQKLRRDERDEDPCLLDLVLQLLQPALPCGNRVLDLVVKEPDALQPQLRNEFVRELIGNAGIAHEYFDIVTPGATEVANALLA
jgi:hypothetical protein